MWGDLGISKVSLNDKELELISEGCRYTYALGNVRTKNVLKMTVNSNFNNASKILSQIVFVQVLWSFLLWKKFGSKSGSKINFSTNFWDQKSIFEQIFFFKNNFPSIYSNSFFLRSTTMENRQRLVSLVNRQLIDRIPGRVTTRLNIEIWRKIKC